jgi:hypothetical protein
MWSHYSSSFIKFQGIPRWHRVHPRDRRLFQRLRRDVGCLAAAPGDQGIRHRSRDRVKDPHIQRLPRAMEMSGDLLENPGSTLGTFRQLGKMRALNLMDANGNFAHQDLRPAVRCSYQEYCEKKHKEYSARGICLNCQRLRIVKVNRTVWLCGWQIPSYVPLKPVKHTMLHHNSGTCAEAGSLASIEMLGPLQVWVMSTSPDLRGVCAFSG